MLVHFCGVYTPNVANLKLPTVEQLACKILGKLSGARASLLPPTRELHPAPAHCSLPGCPLVPATSIPSWTIATSLTDSPGSATVILQKRKSDCILPLFLPPTDKHGSVSPSFKLSSHVTLLKTPSLNHPHKISIPVSHSLFPQLIPELNSFPRT